MQLRRVVSQPLSAALGAARCTSTATPPEAVVTKAAKHPASASTTGVPQARPQQTGATSASSSTASPSTAPKPRRPTTVVSGKQKAKIASFYEFDEDPKSIMAAHKKHADMAPTSTSRYRGWGTLAWECAPLLTTAAFAVGSVTGMATVGMPTGMTAAEVLAAFTATQRLIARGTPCSTPTAADSTGKAPMEGKVCLVTGASSGIGRHVAAMLLDRGATVIATHNTATADATRTSILEVCLGPVKEQLEGDKSAQLVVWPLNFEDRATIPRIVNSVRKQFPKGLDVLVNNAGNMMGEDLELSNDLEKTIDVSFVGPYALTESLLPHVQKVDGRVVYVTSHTHRIVTTRDSPEKIISRTVGYRHKNDADMKYHRYRQFSCAKFGNACHTEAIHRRGVLAASVNPGKVNTLLRRRVFPLLGTRYYLPGVLWQLRTPEEGAQSVVHAATVPADKFVSGGYYYNCKPRPHGLSPFVRPAAEAACEWAAKECKTPLTRLQPIKPPRKERP